MLACFQGILARYYGNSYNLKYKNTPLGKRVTLLVKILKRERIDPVILSLTDHFYFSDRSVWFHSRKAKICSKFLYEDKKLIK